MPLLTRRRRYLFGLCAWIVLFGMQTLLSACEVPFSSPRQQTLTNPHPNNTPVTNSQTVIPDFPVVDPDYIYNSLFYLATHFQKREAGYLRPAGTPDGHAGFANYWAQEMTHNLQGFGPQTSLDNFKTVGWLNRPSDANSTNVAVTIPGATQPQQTVVIGCHYDGEASSTQSANDDASGCAIELGVAKALGNYWRTHNLFPARTLRFVIFDAEEQGLFGSFHYVNQTVNGDLNSIVAMFNEEQNGIAYPLRYLGQTSNPQLPFNIDISPTQSNTIYPQQNGISNVQKSNINSFNALMQQAVPAVFTQFQKMGDGSLTYQNAKNQPVSQPIFGTDQLGMIHQQPDREGGSDQIPFTMAGIPSATFVGNASYYNGPTSPPWSYPFDQPQDTIQMMNTFASGYADKAKALTLSLALPGMLTTWMLHQPQILGEVTTPTHPFGSINMLGLAQTGQNLSFNAQAFEPNTKTSSGFSYNWDFGDGSQANTQKATHTYQQAGTYNIVLTITSSKGSEKIKQSLLISTQPKQVANPYAKYTQDGLPPSNPYVKLPVPKTR
ncbi:MAG TPA: M28 family peptidase [Ktedonobacteraceae bacterium]|nr:M28 family peptidase [Ktedonobacteraceae bacterium]